MPTNSSPLALFSAISNLCKVLGVLLGAHGLADSGTAFWVQLVGGSIMVIGPAVWDVWSQIRALARTKAVGVQAGINLTVSGKALASDGATLVSHNDGTTPPLPVTEATAAQIVKDFAPTAVPAKS